MPKKSNFNKNTNKNGQSPTKNKNQPVQSKIESKQQHFSYTTMLPRKVSDHVQTEKSKKIYKNDKSKKQQVFRFNNQQFVDSQVLKKMRQELQTLQNKQEDQKMIYKNVAKGPQKNIDLENDNKIDQIQSSLFKIKPVQMVNKITQEDAQRLGFLANKEAVINPKVVKTAELFEQKIPEQVPKISLFGQNQSLKNPFSSLFGSNQSSSLFGGLGLQNKSSKGPIGLFSAPQGSLFQGPSLFGNNNMSFGGGSSLFGGLKNSVFNTANQEIPAQASQEQGSQQDEGPIQAQDTFNPNLSSGKYEYLKTQVFFKQFASKFRLGRQQLIENVNVSIEKISQSQSKFIYIRGLNKVIVFSGKLLQQTTEIRYLNNSSKNVQILKILPTVSKQKLELVSIKLQLSEEIGQQLYAKMKELGMKCV